MEVRRDGALSFSLLLSPSLPSVRSRGNVSPSGTFSRRRLTKSKRRFSFADNLEMHSEDRSHFHPDPSPFTYALVFKRMLPGRVCIEIHLTCVPTPVQQPVTVPDGFLFVFSMFFPFSFSTLGFLFFLHFPPDRRRVI